ncbi:unnamed protein product [Tilletia laevis]|uniref:Cyclin n=2 Tax=Tilletia TaxID=13289 RepID=A0A177UYL7_9BASI|nr:hypothetical protein CF335_g3724 [Tilletia laevis]KAE8259598.1 hypothetical protein A4X03_0g4048 [Tilletia caries]CAD6898276.1 unnamed protein product [Tilletia controversa]CAD6891898.1 unnamed protein product [Tilletia caries]CAD6923094.1 unnamed protein product [Tilletia caries]
MDLATYPSTELLRIIAMLLQQIATANDDRRPRGGAGSSSSSGGGGESSRRQQHGYSHGKDTQAIHPPDSARSNHTMSPAAGLPQSRVNGTENGASAPGSGNRPRSGSMRAGREGLHGGEGSRNTITTAAQAALMTPSSTLCFHARNVPTINIESYLLRILKYCPTTNEVFLSLLVYFDRMSRMGSGAEPGEDNHAAPVGSAAGLPQSRTREISASYGESARDGQERRQASGAQEDNDTGLHREPRPGMRGFAIDSFNVHRLIIAGLTVSSKFSSDVFYTNSRYAKVGGLPVHELNQLELQFLLLNDFRMVIPLPELQRYADQLLIYGKGQQQTKSVARPIGHHSSSSDTQGRQRSQNSQSRDRQEQHRNPQQVTQPSATSQ